MAGKVYKQKLNGKSFWVKLHDRYGATSWEEQRKVKMWHILLVIGFAILHAINI